MALFSKKTEEKKDVVVAKKAATEATVVNGRENVARVLSQPRITEKATNGIENGVYVFDVAVNSNKKQIKEAIKRIYNVTPLKVNVTTIRRKTVRNPRTGIRGVKSGGKKAYVYLKKGDTISIM